MPRAKQDMDRATFEQALKQAKALPGEHELNLAGIGESTMHPDFVEYVFRAREVMGPDIRLVLATNGLLMTDELAKAIAPSGIRVYVSMHRPEKAGPAIEACKRAGIIDGVSADPALSATNWAGQVKWHVSTDIKGHRCPWIRGGRLMVMSDGRITRCSFDSTADDVLGTVWDDVTKIETSPYSLCKNCHLVP
jgi:hypothetical protein